MTQNNNYRYEIQTTARPETIWAIIRDPRKWWTGLYNEQMDGHGERCGDEFTFRAGDGVHYSKQRLSRLKDQQLIEWEVVESELTFLDNPAEWTGTSIRFDVFPAVTGNTLVFTHEGLTPDIECYDSCSSAWGGYMKKLEERIQ